MENSRCDIEIRCIVKTDEVIFFVIYCITSYQ